LGQFHRRPGLFVADAGIFPRPCRPELTLLADASDDQDWSERFSELLNTIMPTGTGRPDAEPQSQQVIALTASGQLGMAAAGQIQIQLAVVSLVRGIALVGYLWSRVTFRRRA
jgi:hypothetical protein